MQITPDQGQFMALIAQLMGAKKLLEIGVFTGYSSLAVMESLPADSRLIALDISKTFTDMARRYWRKANLESRIDLRLGPALATLGSLLKENGQQDSFDFIFIDADKPNYPAYYEASLQLVRPGGVILIDNLIWSGKVADPSAQDPDTVTLRNMIRSLRDDPRIDFSLVTLADGLGLARRKNS